jgi:hypothetical protein
VKVRATEEEQPWLKAAQEALLTADPAVHQDAPAPKTKNTTAAAPPTAKAATAKAAAASLPSPTPPTVAAISPAAAAAIAAADQVSATLRRELNAKRASPAYQQMLARRQALPAFGMAAANDFMRRRDNMVVIEQSDRARPRRGIDDQCPHDRSSAA